MMRPFALLLSLLFISFFAAAEVQHLRLASGKVIAYEHIVNAENGPTLILLPGVNRALTESDSSVQLLAKQGWNLLMPSLPAHPLSVRGLKQNESPYFLYDNTIRTNQFAEDIEALTAKLGIKKAIPVTLSYSSSVGAYLNSKKFPHVIETVPLVIPTEGDPEAAKNGELWESWLRLNPFMAPFWIRQFRDQAYSLHWGGTVDQNLSADSGFYGESPRVSDIKAGYVTIARASEDFDFTQWDFSAETRTRDFIFAGAEAPERQKNQIEVLKNYLATGKPVRVLVIAKAGHILPTENPEVYAAAIGTLASQSRESSVQFAIIKSAADFKSLRWQDSKALNKWIEKH